MAINATAHPSFSGCLGLVRDAILGSVWGPLGFESQWVSFVLSAKFYCSLCVSRVWEAEAGILSFRRTTFHHVFFSMPGTSIFI